MKTIAGAESPSAIYRALADGRRPGVLLESARVCPSTGRYSIIASCPFLVFESKGRRIRLESYGSAETLEADPLEKLRGLLSRFASVRAPFPPFTGGAIGAFAYEVKNLIETRLPASAKDDTALPDIHLQFYDRGVVVDHRESCMHLFLNVWVGGDLEKSYRAGARGIRTFESSFKNKMLRGREKAAGRASRGSSSCRVLKRLARREFINKVRRIKDYIRCGDIFQANLSQRFDFTLGETPFRIYEKLKAVNPSPFFGYLDARRFQIISGSPERLVKLENAVLETRPIAGTRSRGRSLDEDLELSRELALDEKERAEHIMLVDLERNDMGRVADYGSVLASELMVIEDYSHVKHIVSNVRGRLREGLDAVDVLKAFFPGGTITGAPKVRCMEILDELEPSARGPYTGSLGYVGFNGNMDLNILIRSLVVKGRRAHLQVGAGIVADSVPEKEYDETLYKAEAVFKTLFGESATAALFKRYRRS